MGWRDARRYVEAFDLSVWVAERANAWQHAAVGRLATDTAIELVSSVSLALTFPDGRDRHLAAADEGVVRLRTVLRVAESLKLLSKGGLRYAAARLAAIGRMVGGWRKRLRRQRPAAAGGSM